ncbi:unnamed protein product [Durusdinium trenchii]|uniref:PPPDE domain-containing protein n=1 Tax=Durusdinium trenchii TaxID=1381693 RepID=A0ABP0Q1V8_9DINO
MSASSPSIFPTFGQIVRRCVGLLRAIDLVHSFRCYTSLVLLADVLRHGVNYLALPGMLEALTRPARKIEQGEGMETLAATTAAAIGFLLTALSQVLVGRITGGRRLTLSMVLWGAWGEVVCPAVLFALVCLADLVAVVAPLDVHFVCIGCLMQSHWEHIENLILAFASLAKLLVRSYLCPDQGVRTSSVKAMGAAIAMATETETESNRRCAALQTLYTAGHKVELAATKLGPGFPGFQAYHTSVKVDDMEYSFSGEGIVVQRGLPSHMRLPDTPEVVYVGLTSLSGDVMQKHLTGFFKRGSYDLLRKNCNSFSDCALYFLLDMRLDPSYKGLEQLGHMADRQAGIVQAVTEGNYRPNPNADTFSVAATIEAINKLKDSPAFRFS